MIASIARFSLVVAASIILVGCASPSDPAAMVPTNAIVGKTHSGSVNLAVSGGHETNGLWTSQVSSKDFQTALESSILHYGVFSRVIQNGGADYRLDVSLVRLAQPLIGFNMTVTSTVAWRLADTKTGRVLWEQTIVSPYTATISDAFIGIERLKLANEGAIRESIKSGIEHISTTSFK